MAKENRKYKDSVFVDLFYRDRDAKKNLLELHNALYGTCYTDPEQVRLIGLEDTLFQNLKNDVAFSVDDRKIVLSEHQSTVNPNMPLRDLMYIAREYEKIIPVKDRYKTSLVKIPVPQFVVFYNGSRDYPLEDTLRLSDAFLMEEKDIALELTVHVININASKKHNILEKCKVLKDYSLFVEATRRFCQAENQLQNAVRECISNGILKDYLLRKSSEVINMLMAEYSYEMDIEVQREEAAEEARKEAQKAIDAAEKALADAVDNAAENFNISTVEACEKLGLSYERYLEIKK